MAEKNLHSFKSDESFLEKISIGAIGTKQVYENLESQGHRPVELERGSMSFKIWKSIKIKRLRVPDILCVDCGIRFESRAKKKLEITMSHSFASEERGWDFGLNNEDYVALVKCKKIGEAPIDWEASTFIQYISVNDLRKAYEEKKFIQEKPKGAQEGFEVRITWPSAVTSSSGIVSEIGKRLKYKRQKDDRTISLSLLKKGIKVTPLVNPGDVVSESQIVASVVPVSSHIKCQHNLTQKDYCRRLDSPSVTERYAATKALAHFKINSLISRLVKVINDHREHIYVRLEAAAALMRSGYKEGINFIETCIKDEYLEKRLEAIIILGEIHSEQSCSLLIQCLLDKDQHPEIRAGAAWSLGELGSKNALDTLVQSFLAVELNIRIEAARALAKLGRKYGRDVLSRLPQVSTEQKPGLAWAIGKAGGFSVDELLPACVDENSRQWVAYILGVQEREKYIGEIEMIKHTDPEVYFAANVLWTILNSWIYGLEEY